MIGQSEGVRLQTMGCRDGTEHSEYPQSCGTFSGACQRTALDARFCMNIIREYEILRPI